MCSGRGDGGKETPGTGPGRLGAWPVRRPRRTGMAPCSRFGRHVGRLMAAGFEPRLRLHGAHARDGAGMAERAHLARGRGAPGGGPEPGWANVARRALPLRRAPWRRRTDHGPRAGRSSHRGRRLADRGCAGSLRSRNDSARSTPCSTAPAWRSTETCWRLTRSAGGRGCGDLDGTIWSPERLYRGHAEAGAGHIVTVASLAGLVPLPGLAYYSAAKHAVVAFSLALRAEARSMACASASRARRWSTRLCA